MSGESTSGGESTTDDESTTAGADAGPARDAAPSRPSGLPAAVLALAALAQFALVVASPVQGPDSTAGVLFGIALLTVPVLAMAGFVDSRRVRRHARRVRASDAETAAWNQPLRGAGWVLGMALPILGVAVVAAYLGRRWETGHPLPAVGAPAERTVAQGWRGWRALVAGGALLTTATVVAAVAANDPTASDNTRAQNVAIFAYFGLALLPALATHFDARNVATRVRRWWLGWRLAWAASMLAFVLNVGFAAGYLYRRRSRLAALSEQRETFEERLETAAGAVERAETALEAGEFDDAVAALEGVDGPLETARETAADSPALDEYRARRLQDRVAELRERADVGEERLAFEKQRGRAEAAVERAETALEEGDLTDAIEALAAATDAYDAAVDLSAPLEADTAALRSEREAVTERRREALDRLRSERALPLAERVESLLAEAASARKDGAFDDAAAALDEAEEALADLETLLDEQPLDVEPPADAEDIEAERERLRAARTRAAVESRLETAADRRAAAARALDEGAFDDAAAALDEAEDALAAAADRVDGAGLDDHDIEARRAALADLREAVDEHRRRAAFEGPLERGDEALSEARDAAEVERYGVAREACERARAAFTEARDAAADYDPAAPETVDERLATVADLYADCTVSWLSGRLTDLPDPEAVRADDPDPYANLADDYRALLDDVDAADVDRERDLAVLRSEAARGHVGARVGALAARTRGHADTFRAGEYAAARDGFEAVAESVAEVRGTAADLGVEEFDDELDTVASVAEANAEAARRATLGIEEDPSLERMPPVLGGLATVDRAAATDTPSGAGAGGGEGGGLTGATGGDDVADRLQAELPEHEVLEFVGSGGNADVHRVRLADGREAALKVPTWEGTLSRSAVERFVGEAETWAKLDSHEGIVPVLDWGSSPYPWMLLEYLPASLDERVDALPFDRRLDVLVAVCDALEYAHGRGVVHLDVKPENVLLTADDAPKVGDWGLARVLLEHTRTGMGLTPAYSAPEQLSDDYGEVDRRTDVYQASVLAYRALTGRLPFTEERPAALREAILGDEVPPPSTVADCPAAVDAVLLKGLARDPADRYETAVLLRNALADLG